MTWKTTRRNRCVRRAPSALFASSRNVSQDDILDLATSNRYNLQMGKIRHQKLSDQLRQAVLDAGVSRYRIAQDACIDEAALSKFVHGERGLSLDTLDRLAEYLKLEITTRREKRQRKKR